MSSEVIAIIGMIVTIVVQFVFWVLNKRLIGKQRIDRKIDDNFTRELDVYDEYIESVSKVYSRIEDGLRELEMRKQVIILVDALKALQSPRKLYLLNYLDNEDREALHMAWNSLVDGQETYSKILNVKVEKDEKEIKPSNDIKKEVEKLKNLMDGTATITVLFMHNLHSMKKKIIKKYYEKLE